MGKGKGMTGDANKEPLGSRTKIPTHNSSPIKQEKNDEDLPHFRAEGLSDIFGSIKQEGDNEYSFRSRSPLETHQPACRKRSRSRSRSPDVHYRSVPRTRRYYNHYRPRSRSPKSSYISQSPHKSRQSRRSNSSISAQKISTSSSYRSRSPYHRDQDTRNGSYYEKSSRRGSSANVGASRGSFFRPSPHRDTPTDRGVQNSDYYRPSYSIRDASMFSEYKSRTLSLASTYILRKSLDDEETLTTESWTKSSSRKHREFVEPAYKSLERSSPIEESWVEIASRKHKESMAIKAANKTTSNHIPLATSVGESKPLKQTITLEQSASVSKDTPVSPVTDVRSLLVKRKKQSKAEGLDIQHQISSLLYSRMRKPRQIPPTESKMKVTTDVEKDVGFAKSFESSAQHSSTPPLPITSQEMHSQSEALLSASDQGIHPERQDFLNDSPMLVPSSQRSSISSKSTFVTVQDIDPPSEINLPALNQGMHLERQFLLQTSPLPNESPEHLHLQAEFRLTNSPPKIKIDTQTLQSKIQEIRRVFSSDEKPRPIPSIMNELPFTDDPFESDQYAVEPVIPTHWQD
ncbi:uncharacterized protein EAE97_004364 [Botrytis byssoidea]|uniref:Uncharacterized protein n=1 Tax=Botrytis byssoidea TaxID=139641 RepID=A0A9P5IPT7_9HELO|nr:uncharacterized protein EAE97_004364 [Botrytis byssoidea]KAF7947115.1 hypothetical protein EAE97_004364 [Botrytis byssoidea]